MGNHKRQLNMMRMAVKMAAFPTIAVLLLCCSAVTYTDSCDLYAETNKDFTVPLVTELSDAARLQWKRDQTTVFTGRSNKGFKETEEISSNGSLLLKKVSKVNAGLYTSEVFDSNGIAVGKKECKLYVIDPVRKPTLKITCQKNLIKLTCDVPQTQTKDLNWVWTQSDKVLIDKKDQTLQLPITDDLKTATFSCRVSNKVSSQASATEKQTCIKPGIDFPKQIFGISTWYFVGGGGGVVLLLIILVIVCCIRMKRKKTMQVKDEEELRLGWTNPNQQHHHHQHGPAPNQHHHHHQQQPAGHTGPRQHRSKQPRNQQRPSRDPAHPNGQPQPSPRRAAQVPRPVDTTDDEKPPPLPQPRKKAPKTPRV